MQAPAKSQSSLRSLSFTASTQSHNAHTTLDNIDTANPILSPIKIISASDMCITSSCFAATYEITTEIHLAKNITINIKTYLSVIFINI